MNLEGVLFIMKHTNKKGFTIVELVIVIAVIAILAAVLIPNLSRLVTKADKSAAMQEAKAAMDNDLINAEGDLANMTKYQAKDSSNKVTKQYYIIKELGESENASDDNVKIGVDSNGTVVSTGATKYYEAHAFDGIYVDGTYTIEKGDFTCTFANGAWTVADKT